MVNDVKNGNISEQNVTVTSPQKGVGQNKSQWLYPVGTVKRNAILWVSPMATKLQP